MNYSAIVRISFSHMKTNMTVKVALTDQEDTLHTPGEFISENAQT